MVSAVIFIGEKSLEAGQKNASLALSRSLGALVAAAIAGVLRDVILAGPKGLDLDFIAEHAGCAVVEGEDEGEWLSEALELARGPQCLMLCAGYVPGTGFIEELQDLSAGHLPFTGLYRADPQHLAERLFPRLTPIVGAVAPLDDWRAHPAQSFARRAGALKGHTFRTTMHRVG